MKKQIIISIAFLVWGSFLPANATFRLSAESVPFTGAQVFIEPGQSPELIDSWFQILQENGMHVCRIRMFETYMAQPDGSWDFSLFDYAFRSADRHGIKIYATLFPATDKTDIGGWKFPADETQQTAFARFIKALVTHYKDHPALTGWVLINEPGLDKLPDTPFINQERSRWKQGHPARDFKANGYPVLMDTREPEFHTQLNTDMLAWIAGEIKKYDIQHDIHVNNHAIFQNYGQYDFPAWRNFLTSLGGSAHASWHFGYFGRQDYALALLANAEIIRSGAGNLPWFMTELQGGNNTYSGLDAMCPTPEEITQWLWITLGCEGKGAIFWSLNPRSSGIEAGEWAMIDFQGKPTGRLLATQKVSRVIETNAGLFKNLRIIPSNIDIIYFKESLWAENLMAIGNDKYAGRQPGAVIKSSVACLRALTERGLNAGLKDINEYDFTQQDFTGKSIIISNQISIPEKYLECLETFVTRGGTLLVEGLTAFFDEDLHTTMNTGFMFENLFGGNISEFILRENLFTTEVDGYNLPTHLWNGKIAGQESAITIHPYGKGKVIWIPSNVALGAWVSGNYQPLSDYLFSVLPHNPAAISFERHHNNIIVRTLQSGPEKLLICINKSPQEKHIPLNSSIPVKKAHSIYASPGCYFTGNTIHIQPESVLVIKYQ